MSDVFSNISICKVTSCGKLYIHVGFEEGQSLPCRIMATLGKAGNCQACHLEAFTAGLNVVLDIQDMKAFFRILSETEGIRCPKPYPGAQVDNSMPLSCVDGLVKATKEAILMREGGPPSEDVVKITVTRPIEPPVESAVTSPCPWCGAQLIKQSSCEHCPDPACGYSTCG